MKRVLRVIIIIFLINNVNLIMGNTTDKPEEMTIPEIMSKISNKRALPNQKRINIIFYVLQNTKENNIHQMRGEKDNKLLVKDDGAEAVYNKVSGELVTNFNKGSYNYYNYKEEPIKKFLFDSLPWLKWGVSKDDPTTEMERLYYYTMDINNAIQKYIFVGSKNDLKEVEISLLSKEEKNVFRLFDYLLFNELYTVKLTDDNLEKLEKEAEFYWSYFYQIHYILGMLY